MNHLEIDDIHYFFKIGNVLGQGYHNEVYDSIDLINNQYCALKKYNNLKTKEDLENSHNKISLVNNIKSSYVLKFDNSYYMVNENGEFTAFSSMRKINNDLFELVTTNKLTVENKLDIVNQLIFGLDDIHKANILHNDIKLDNILVDDKNKVFYIDFDDSIDLSKKHDKLRLCPTDIYKAPEIFSNKYKFDPFSVSNEILQKIDVWQLGLTIYSLFTGNFINPHRNNVEYFKAIENYDFQNLTADVPKKVLELLRYMLVKNVYDRPTINQVKVFYFSF